MCNMCKQGGKIKKMEHGSLDRNLANLLRGVTFRRCQLCCVKRAETTKSALFLPLPDESANQNSGGLYVVLPGEFISLI